MEVDEDGDVNMDDDEMGDDDEVAQAEGDAAAPEDLDGAILDPFLDLFVEDEGDDLSTDGRPRRAGRIAVRSHKPGEGRPHIR